MADEKETPSPAPVAKQKTTDEKFVELVKLLALHGIHYKS